MLASSVKFSVANTHNFPRLLAFNMSTGEDVDNNSLTLIDVDSDDDPPTLSPNYYSVLDNHLKSNPFNIEKSVIPSNGNAQGECAHRISLTNQMISDSACASSAIGVSISQNSEQTNTIAMPSSCALSSIGIHSNKSSQQTMQTNTNSIPSTSGAASQQSTSTTVPANNANNSQKRHIRKYAQYNTGPYTVFMHELDIPIAPLTFSSYIHNNYKSVELVKHSRGKLKIILKCWKEANALVVDQKFKQFHVTIPADLVEVVGAIDMKDISDIKDASKIIQHGKGGFNNTSLLRCNILQAEQLFYRNSETPDGDKLPTNTIKITFEGQVLPDYLIIDCLRVRVRPFYNKPMFCNTCQQFGHTEKYCKQKVKCARCKGGHVTSSCNAENIDMTICPFCLRPGEHNRVDCDYFKEATEGFKIKQQQRLKTIRQQVNASIRSIATSSQTPDLNNAADFPILKNRFARLEVDDPQPSTSLNSPQPPPNPYSGAIKSKFKSQSTARVAEKRPRSYASQVYKVPVQSTSESTPTVPPIRHTSRRRSVSRVSRGASNIPNRASANPLISMFKAAILAWVSKSSISPTWLSIIEAIIDPLLEAILPALTSIIDTCPPQSPLAA